MLFDVGRAKVSSQSLDWQDISRHHCIWKISFNIYRIYRRCSRYSPLVQQLVFDHLDSLVSAPSVHILLDHILNKAEHRYFFIQSRAVPLCYAISLRNGRAEQRNTTRYFRKTFTLDHNSGKTHSHLLLKHKTPSPLQLRHRPTLSFLMAILTMMPTLHTFLLLSWSI